MPEAYNFLPLHVSHTGIRHYYADTAEGGAIIRSEADVLPILEANKAQATHNDGYTKDRSWRRVATIPLIIIEKWKNEEGWDALSSDPDCQKKLAAKLDSSEYAYLRTAPGCIGDHWRHHI